jgi:hypothetical protein
MTQGPDPRAAVRGFIALVLDMVRIDPDRRPSAEMQRWHRELAASIGVVPENPATNRELLNGALRLSQVLNGPDGAAVDARTRAEASA